MDKKKKTILDFQMMKDNGEKWCLVAIYDYIFASLLDKTDIPMILVGDSFGMLCYGYEGTTPVTLEQMLDRCKAVRAGAPNTFVIGDMPFGSYEESPQQAVHNAVRIIKETRVDAIKLEGGRRVADKMKAIVDAGIVAIGHVGLTPQSSAALGGFKAQARNAQAARELLLDCIAIEDAGAKALMVEAVPAEVMELIRKRISIPILGGGVPVDCQCMTSGDLLGLFQAFLPKMCKRYANLGDEAVKAFQSFYDEVQAGIFPAPENAYRLNDDAGALLEMFKEFEQ